MADLEVLRQFDTPTICNALEMIDSSRAGAGYTRSGVVAVNRFAGPVVGVARTATMRSEEPSGRSPADLVQGRLDYYEYMHAGDDPKICVLQDLDRPEAVHGPFFGEFNTRIHRAMGFHGILTDGCIRDVRKLPADVLLLSRGLRPSHAHVRVVSYGGPVRVFGMDVTPGAAVHADEHGAVTFPVGLAGEIAMAAAEFTAREAPIIAACNQGRLTFSELRRLYLARE